MSTELKCKVENRWRTAFNEVVNIPDNIWRYLEDAPRYAVTMKNALTSTDALNDLMWIVYDLLDFVEWRGNHEVA